GVEGYYIMVLDEYKQIYIGKTENIKRRIMQHWSKTKQFDRTLFPMYAYKKSCFSIDFIRALDTTRIYGWKRKLLEGLEDKLIRQFPKQFCTNRIGGDVTNGIQALATMNQRDLSQG
ncbi:MAG: GIY-YIG nuclease family protein, partial [Clostridia bacterium]|nr:GIY-YIG nuclease family protein [Clostridia bacterium]